MAVDLTRRRKNADSPALPTDNVEKILQAIKNQRWFFFRNNSNIFLDRDTAFIWTNLDFFPYLNGDRSYTNYNSYHYVKELVKQENSQKYCGFECWRVPKPGELWKIVADEFFPFRDNGKKWTIKSMPYWCIDWDNGKYSSKNLTQRGATSYISNSYDVCVILCNSALVPENFCSTPQEVLNIFTSKNLIPIFNDAPINDLYKKIFIDKTAQAENPSAQETTKPAPIKLTAKFDYRPLLAKYDAAAIAKSPIKYFDAVLDVTNELLDVLQGYEAAQADTIAENLKITLKLKAKYTDNPNLTPEENSLLAERQKFLAARLELATDEPKRKILSVKAQAEDFFTLLDAINAGNNAIRALAALQAEPRADFELLVENMARIVLDTQRRIDFFTQNKNLVANVVETQASWSDNYKAFKTAKREELAAACRNDGIDDEIFAAWYDDWQIKRFAIEQRFLPLIEFALKGNLSDAFENVLKILHAYRDSVDKFYLNERKNIYQKFAFQAGGDLQEKFETESTLYKSAEKLQRDLQTIIFARDKTEERIFLLRWAEPLLNLPLDEISNFIRDRELDAIAEEVLNQFAELRRQNFEKYLADSKSYSEAVQRRESEFNALIFRMRKDLRAR